MILKQKMLISILIYEYSLLSFCVYIICQTSYMICLASSINIVVKKTSTICTLSPIPPAHHVHYLIFEKHKIREVSLVQPMHSCTGQLSKILPHQVIRTTTPSRVHHYGPIGELHEVGHLQHSLLLLLIF